MRWALTSTITCSYKYLHLLTNLLAKPNQRLRKSFDWLLPWPKVMAIQIFILLSFALTEGRTSTSAKLYKSLICKRTLTRLNLLALALQVQLQIYDLHRSFARRFVWPSLLCKSKMMALPLLCKGIKSSCKASVQIVDLQLHLMPKGQNQRNCTCKKI